MCARQVTQRAHAHKHAEEVSFHVALEWLQYREDSTKYKGGGTNSEGNTEEKVCNSIREQTSSISAFANLTS